MKYDRDRDYDRPPLTPLQQAIVDEGKSLNADWYAAESKRISWLFVDSAKAQNGEDDDE